MKTWDRRRSLQRLNGASTRCFPPKAALMRKLLLEECGHDLPFSIESDSAAMDRCRFAALRVSGGDWQKLHSAVRLAKTDWRDLLVVAGFANDPQAHTRWTP